jgi:hypothetical protein
MEGTHVDAGSCCVRTDGDEQKEIPGRADRFGDHDGDRHGTVAGRPFASGAACHRRDGFRGADVDYRGDPLRGERDCACIPVDPCAWLFTRRDGLGEDSWNREGHTARAQRLLKQRLAVRCGGSRDGGGDHQHGAREAGGLSDPQAGRRKHPRHHARHHSDRFRAHLLYSLGDRT